MSDATTAVEIAPMMGAPAPSAGKLVFAGGAGVSVILPHLTLEGRIGLGSSTSLELRYRNLVILGHLGQARFTWAMPVGSRFYFGLAARTGIGVLGGADETKSGIDFSSLSIGNDWEVGHDFLLTWSRPNRAQISWSLGPTYALAGPRYSNYDDRAFRWDARLQTMNASVTGEWDLSPSRRFFIRFEALFLIKADVVPYGFLPTITLGLAWST